MHVSCSVRIKQRIYRRKTKSRDANPLITHKIKSHNNVPPNAKHVDGKKNEADREVAPFLPVDTEDGGKMRRTEIIHQIAPPLPCQKKFRHKKIDD